MCTIFTVQTKRRNTVSRLEASPSNCLHHQVWRFTAYRLDVVGADGPVQRERRLLPCDIVQCHHAVRLVRVDLRKIPNTVTIE